MKIVFNGAVAVLLLSLSLATAVLAEESPIKTTFSGTDALRVKTPYDKIAPDNVVVKGVITGGNMSGHKEELEKELTLTIGGNNFGACTVEACIVVQRDNNKSKFPQVALASAHAPISQKETTLVVTLSAPTDIDFKGWFVRVVNQGRVVGVAGSSEVMETMAADPLLKVRYTPLPEPAKKKKPKK